MPVFLRFAAYVRADAIYGQCDVTLPANCRSSVIVSFDFAIHVDPDLYPVAISDYDGSSLGTDRSLYIAYAGIEAMPCERIDNSLQHDVLLFSSVRHGEHSSGTLRQ
jgi:hypothetical protein